MGKLNEDYYWKAYFSTGTLEQYDIKDKEVLFKEVEKKMSDLKKFELISSDNKEVYTVDLVNKKILGPGVSYSITGTSPKLIFFKRNSVRAEVGTGNVLKPLTIFHFGIKTSTQEKKLEVFKGLGQNPKKVEYNDVKAKTKSDLTKSISVELKKIK